jgi:hypothetical protein
MPLGTELKHVGVKTELKHVGVKESLERAAAAAAAPFSVLRVLSAQVVSRVGVGGGGERARWVGVVHL